MGLILRSCLIFDTYCLMEAKDYISQAVKANGAATIAAMAGVSRATVFRVMSGNNTRIDTMRKLLKASGHDMTIRAESLQASGE